MAACAIQICPAVDHGRLRLKLCRFFMAVRTRDCKVAAGQREVRLLMIRKRECRRPVSLKIVATITGVEIRCGGKLAGMAIGVALSAAIELDLE